MAKPRSAADPTRDAAPAFLQQDPHTLGELLFLAVPRDLFQALAAEATRRGTTVAVLLADVVTLILRWKVSAADLIALGQIAESEGMTVAQWVRSKVSSASHGVPR